MVSARSGSWLWWMPAILWASLIFFLSNQSQVPGGLGRFPDYVLHFGGYAILAGAVAAGFQRGVPLGIEGSIAARSWLLATLYGFSDEFHQMFVPGRQSSWSDLLADSLGSFCAVSILVFLACIKGGSDAR